MINLDLKPNTKVTLKLSNCMGGFYLEPCKIIKGKPYQKGWDTKGGGWSLHKLYTDDKPHMVIAIRRRLARHIFSIDINRIVDAKLGWGHSYWPESQR